jgi:hypothetical protein
VTGVKAVDLIRHDGTVVRARVQRVGRGLITYRVRNRRGAVAVRTERVAGFRGFRPSAPVAPITA